MKAPTCEELYEEDGFVSVHRESDDSWRHGCYIYEVFCRDLYKPIEKIVIDYVDIGEEK